MTHPDGIFLALAPDPVEQWCILGDGHLGAAEFAMMTALNLATELLRHGLLAIADAKQRNAGLIDRLWRQRCVLVEDGGGPTGKNHRLRLHLTERLFGFLVWHDL